MLNEAKKIMKYRGKKRLTVILKLHFSLTRPDSRSFFFLLRYKTVFDINVHTGMKERGILF